MHDRGVSPVLATMIMVGVTVAVGLGVASYTIGLFGNLSRSAQISVISVDIDATKNEVTFELDNRGGQSVALDKVEVNIGSITYSSTPNKSIGASSTTIITINDLGDESDNSPDFMNGKMYTFTLRFSDGKILTVTGTTLSADKDNNVIVVSSSNMNGWKFIQESGDSGSASVISGYDTPPLGSGSARFVIGDSDDGWTLLLSNTYDVVRLDEITKLEYSSYVASASYDTITIALHFDIDDDVTDDDDSWKSRLIYEPRYTETIEEDRWQTWNPMTEGKWWGTNSPVSDKCSWAKACSWDEVLDAFPNAGIKVKVLLKAGSGWKSFDGSVDAFTIGINNINTTYDFEP
ncbi:MAG: type IV pilin [Candidatus Nitrosothermus koennekii]|nr:MAG: type IV pilin [Candidatus Nitrosothermus koennekii]